MSLKQKVDFAPPRETARKTRSVVSDNLAFFSAVTLGYLVVYLWLIGDLAVVERPGAFVEFELGPLANTFRRISAFYFEAVASVAVGPVFLLVSVGNLLVGGTIAALVGANLTFTYVSFTNPSACSARNKTGLLSAVPALAAGTTCCAPVVFIALGIQASAGLLALQTAALPLSVLALLVALSVVAPKVDVDVEMAA